MLAFYILGVIVAFIAILWFEKEFIVNGDLKRLTGKEWMQDIALSFLSWITVVLVIIVAKMQKK